MRFRVSRDHRASAALDESDEADRMEGERRGLRLRLKGVLGISLSVATAAAVQAWPGGLLYSLSWFMGFTAAGLVLALPPWRALRAFEAERRQSLIAEQPRR